MRSFLAAVVACLFPPVAAAAVVVVANFTPAEVAIVVTEPGGAKKTIKLSRAQVVPVTVGGPAVLSLPGVPQPYTIDPYNAYVILPDEKTGRRLEGVELPGDPPAGDAKPVANLPPRAVVKVPVTLLVDEIDPRADVLWRDTLKKRLAAASDVVEAHAGIRFEPAGFALWKSDPEAKTVPALLADFEEKAKAPPGGLALGYTSRKVEEKDDDKAPLGASAAAPATHLLMREWTPRSEAGRVEALAHHLGRFLGAVPVPDPGSVMRPKLDDGLALHAEYKMRFDPLNALALNLWADERRGGKLKSAADVSADGKTRLKRVYNAILMASPGDPSALVYLNEFDRVP